VIQRAAFINPLETCFQPIFEAQNGERTLHAVECLTRGPHGSAFETAPRLFDYVRRQHLEPEIDRLCIAQALRAAGGGGTHRISVNVHPVTLAVQRDFPSFLERESAAAGIDSTRLIVEIGEQQLPADGAAFGRALAALRDRGTHIAIDDVGSAHANYRSILDCRPEYLKIDRYFVEGISEDPARRAVVRSICDLAGFFEATVVAEGVERPEDDRVLCDLGIRFFQGFLYARPSSPLAYGDRRTTVARAWLNARLGVQPTR
jgi:EAL domain-containing protein (putative c-di-GMP-specific phosphodiesterase class I)